jgi:K+-sensing histidine kinase KdpD
VQGSDCLIDICDDGSGWQQPQPAAMAGVADASRANNISTTTQARPDAVPHHGIGLAIVSRVAHQHGGDFIRLDRPGGGAIARLRLPLGSETTNEAAATADKLQLSD